MRYQNDAIYYRPLKVALEQATPTFGLFAVHGNTQNPVTLSNGTGQTAFSVISAEQQPCPSALGGRSRFEGHIFEAFRGNRAEQDDESTPVKLTAL